MKAFRRIIQKHRQEESSKNTQEVKRTKQTKKQRRGEKETYRWGICRRKICLCVSAHQEIIAEGEVLKREKNQWRRSRRVRVRVRD